MLRTMISRRTPATLAFRRAYVSDPFNSSKPTSQKHATEKDNKSLNIQSDAVEKGMNDKKNAEPSTGQKKRPEDTTRAPGP